MPCRAPGLPTLYVPESRQTRDVVVPTGGMVLPGKYGANQYLSLAALVMKPAPPGLWRLRPGLRERATYEAEWKDETLRCPARFAFLSLCAAIERRSPIRRSTWRNRRA
jgi:hypothetical protein